MISIHDVLDVLKKLVNECQLHNEEYTHVTPKELMDRAREIIENEEAILDMNPGVSVWRD